MRRVDWTDVLVELDGRKTIGNWLHIRPLENPRKRGRGKLRDPIDVPVAPQLRGVLQDEWGRQGKPSHGPIVQRSLISGRLYRAADKCWADENLRRRERLGRPLRRRERREAWSAEHELEPIRLHECRHTYASWLMASRKWSTGEMMEFMGITQLSTFQRYAKVIEQHGPRLRGVETVDLFDFRRAREG